MIFSVRSFHDRQLIHLDDAYGAMLEQSFALPLESAEHAAGFAYKEEYLQQAAFQRASINLAKKQETHSDEMMDEDASGSAFQPAEDEQSPILVPLALALQGPAAAAWELLKAAKSTEEQIDAVALFALSLQQRFDRRPDKSSHLLPVALPHGNHRALWLGGGGVGKTHTLCNVVEPLSVTYFGENGYAATAPSNFAAQNLGPRGRFWSVPQPCSLVFQAFASRAWVQITPSIFLVPILALPFPKFPGSFVSPGIYGPIGERRPLY